MTSNELAAAKTAALAVPGRLKFALVGSAYTYSLEQARDIDVLVLVTDVLETAEALAEQGWQYPPNHDPNYALLSNSIPMRHGALNLLLTGNETWYEGFARAAEVCRYLAVDDRAKRVALHQIIRDGRPANEYMHDPAQAPGWAR
jgi:hypothetical protein